MSNGLLLLVRLVVAVLASAVLVYWWYWLIGGLKGVLLGVVFSAPVIGIAIARPLVHLTHEGFTWLSQQPLAQYQGRFYAFDEVQVRVEEFDDGLRFNAGDVARATALPGIPGTAGDYLDLQTIEKWRARRREPTAGRFLLWARREVVGPWKKKQEKR